ncbi:MAG: TPM domain-containing protein [Candidatus Omnitrophica bacterium]|nr:TPM domain-containing protein [Candidatus Omnitrophota bacterium]
MKRSFITSVVLTLAVGAMSGLNSPFNDVLRAQEAGLLTGEEIKFLAARRPARTNQLFDYANVLDDAADYTLKYLQGLKEDYGIEALIVSMPTLSNRYTVEEFAVEIFSNWDIGRANGGRGLLLLLINDTKEIKLEVASELEGVYTDAFSGYVEDKQLKAYYLSGQLGTGILAVMEEMEKRARLRLQENFTTADVAYLDQAFLSQGAGATRELHRYQEEPVSEVSAKYPAGATADEAWQTIIRSYKEKARDPNLGVYTEMTKLAYQDYTNLPDSHYVEEYNKYADKEYEIFEKGDYAVVFFGKKDGWENAPFLLCRTDAGWQFDIVHQRKYIRMGRNPKWGIERAMYPHIDLLWRCPYFHGQDIPLLPEDRYYKSQDVQLGADIRRLTERVKNNPHDAEGLIELGRLATITSHSRSRIQWLNKAKALNPRDPHPYKYLAISHVDMFYQYEKAIAEIKEYIKLVPDDVFGHNYLGYLYLQVKDYDKAVKSLDKAVKLQPDNCYAYCKLARTYAALYKKILPVNPKRFVYLKKVTEMLQKAETTPTKNALRVHWLKNWLKGRGLE